MKIRFQINEGDGEGVFDYEHPALPHVGDIVHLRDGPHAFCVALVRHIVGTDDIQAHVFLRDATQTDLAKAEG